MALTQSEGLSVEQYLADEAVSEDRHEYFDGLIYAMTGGTSAHNTLALNLHMALRPHLKGSPCRIYVNDMRLRVDAANCYFYPDVVVTCEAVDAKTTTLESAKVIVEVLSPATSNYDQGKKFAVYRQLESLQEYVLIDSELKSVRVYRRAEQGDWIFHAYTNDETVRLASIDFSVSLTELYDDTGIEE
ncbi:Uma2 family endonuclease [Deefgea piscis]|uniref:Uma2 family endonuclease n=1 Tax=Deefgea piscis TaxID=2739061 RepID=A0A6M8SPB0_9NEIS|nr:Uma2 family endonuclease [Deefgea piscis]QKJ65998.1 Uma2 family endonuclease [Deefgea piscis]